MLFFCNIILMAPHALAAVYYGTKGQASNLDQGSSSQLMGLFGQSRRV